MSEKLLFSGDFFAVFEKRKKNFSFAKSVLGADLRSRLMCLEPEKAEENRGGESDSDGLGDLCRVRWRSSDLLQKLLFFPDSIKPS